MFKDKTIICISPISWNFLWQRHQIFMKMFAEKGNKVLFIESFNPSAMIEPSIFSKALKRINRIIFRLINKKEQGAVPNLTIITPFIIPFRNNLADFINKNIFLNLLIFYIKLKGVKNPIVWTYLGTSSALKLINNLKPEFLVYDCVFDAHLHPDSPIDIDDSEQKIIESSDLVLTDNSYLFKKCRSLNSNAHMIPPGVDFEHFASPPLLTHPGLLNDLKRPIICFFGGIDQIRIDLELIEYIAKNRLDWNIVLFGPVVKTDITTLKLKNIFLKGVLSYQELPIHLREVDVLIIPYKIIPFSKSIFPAKIFECLATGKPIISTSLEELGYFEKGLIKIAGTKEEFLKSIEEALISDTEENKKNRQHTAKQNSWSSRLEKLNILIQETVLKKVE